jgi:hypothetical protein
MIPTIMGLASPKRADHDVNFMIDAITGVDAISVGATVAGRRRG